MVDEIAKTTKLKDEYSIKVDSLWLIMCDISHGGEDKSKKKSKVISLERSIEEHKKMIKTLEHTLQSQRKKLEEMTDGGDDVDISSNVGPVHLAMVVVLEKKTVLTGRVS